jgi:hypothetical protein
MKPPTFFLSSTIYDFKDLRSAIKYYLEQQGCRVLASDFNDFPKPPKLRGYVGDEMEVSTIKLLGMLHVMDRVCNIIELSKVIIRYLDGQPFLMPSLRPPSPMYAPGELEKQEVTAAETEAFLLK